MFAPDTATASGMPWASDSTRSVLPFLPRSTGFGPPASVHTVKWRCAAAGEVSHVGGRCRQAQPL